MKKYVHSSVCALILLLVFALLFTGCENRKALEQYQTDVTQIVTRINDARDTLNIEVTAFSQTLSKEDRQNVLSAVTELSSAFAAFSELEAPGRYTEVQTALEESAEEAGQGTDIYMVEFTTVSEDTFDQDFVKRVTEGDRHLERAVDMVAEATGELAAENGA